MEPNRNCEPDTPTNIELERNCLNNPPHAFEFNNLLADLSNELERNSKSDDFKRAKNLLKGIISDDVESWLQVFDCLRIKGYISEDSTVYLQKILNIIHRKDLIKKLIDYVNRRDNDETLHFNKPKIQIDNGRKEVQFHVKGQYCRTHQQAQELVRTAARILCIPEQDVTLSGIEEVKSLLVSIIIPDIYADILVQLLQDEIRRNYITRLVKLGVDYVIVSEERYFLPQQESAPQYALSDKIMIPHDFIDKEELIEILQRSGYGSRFVSETKQLTEENDRGNPVLRIKLEGRNENKLCITRIKVQCR